MSYMDFLSFISGITGFEGFSRRAKVVTIAFYLREYKGIVESMELGKASGTMFDHIILKGVEVERP